MRFTRHPTTESAAPVAFAAWLGRQLLMSVLILLLLVTVGLGFLGVNRDELLRRAAILHLRYELQREVTLQRLHIDLRGQVLAEGLAIYDGFSRRRVLWSARRIDLRFDPFRFLAAPRRPLGAMRQVVVDDPYLVVTRGSTGQWNFQDLLKRKRKPSTDRFRGELIVRNGEILFQDARGFGRNIPPFSEHLIRVNARVTQAGGDYLPFRLSAATATGHLRDISLFGSVQLGAQRSQCEVRCSGINLAYVRKFLPNSLPVTLMSGQVDGRVQVIVAVNPKTRAIDLQTTLVADLHDLRGTFTQNGITLPCFISDGQLRMADDMVELAAVRGRVNMIPFTAEGTITHFAEPVFALQLKTQNALAAAMMRLLPDTGKLPITVSGMVDGWVQIVGTITEPQVCGHVAGPAVRATVGNFSDLQSDFTFDGETVQFANLTARGYDGYLAGRAWVKVGLTGDTLALFTGQASRVSAQSLVTQLMAGAPPPANPNAPSLRDVSGILSGPVTIRADRDERAVIIARVHGDAEVADVTAGTVDANVKITVDGTRAVTHIERLEALTREGLFQAQGDLDADTSLHLTIRGSRLNLAAIGARAQQPDLQGTGYLTGTLDGLPDQLAFTGALHVQQGRVQGRAFDDLYGDIQASLGSNMQFNIRNMRLIAGSSQLKLPATEFSIDTATGDWNAAGKVELPRTSLKELATTLGIELPISGLVEGEASFTGNSDMPIAGGTVWLRRPTINLGDTMLELDSVLVTFTLRREMLTISDAEVVYEGVPFQVKGTLALQPQGRAGATLALQLRAPHVDLDKLTTLASSPTDPLIGKMTKDFKLCLPLDVEGDLALSARITARLDAAKGETPEQTLANSLVVTGTVQQADMFKIVGVPYQELLADVEYHGNSHEVSVKRFALTRDTGHSSYRFVLPLPQAGDVPAPGTLNLDSQIVDFNVALGNADFDGRDMTKGADLELLRRDLATITAGAGDDPQLAELAKGLREVAQPFSGIGAVSISLSSLLTRPTIAAQVALDKVVVGGMVMPKIDGAFVFDTASRTLECQSVTAVGGPNPDATMTVQGAIQLPMKDARGKEIEPGVINNLECTADSINPGMLGIWLRNPALAQLGGKATVYALIKGTTAHPAMTGSIDIMQPTFNSVRFDSLSAPLHLENDRLWIGRKGMGGEGAATLNFTPPAGADAAEASEYKMEPLLFYGYLPFVWKGTLQPDIPLNKPMAFNVSLPFQSLDIARAYLPQPEPVAANATKTLKAPAQLSGTPDAPVRNGAARMLLGRTTPVNALFKRTVKNDGTVKIKAMNTAPASKRYRIFAYRNAEKPNELYEVTVAKLHEDAGVALGTTVGTIQGALEVRGTLEKPDITNGSFLLNAPELILPNTDKDLPNRLRQVHADLSFHSRVTSGKRENILEVHDLSALYDRDESDASPKTGALSWLKSLLGKKTDSSEAVNGALAAEGTISLGLPKGLTSLADIPALLEYDLYAKMVRTPIRWRNMLRGTITSYLRLGNEPGTHNPLLTGVIYAEDCRLLFAGEQAPPTAPPHFPFNPALKVAIQLGQGNVFELGADNPVIQGIGSAKLPFVPTTAFSPIAPADRKVQHETKPPLDRTFSSFRYTAKTLQSTPENGTYAYLTGTLARPILGGNVVVVPGKSQVQLPGGELTVQEAKGTMFFPFFPDPTAPEQQPKLEVKGNATGTVGKYTVAAKLHGNLMQTDLKSQIDFETVTSPQGAPPLSSDEIQNRLFGLSDIASLLQGKEKVVTTVSRIGQTVMFRDWFRQLAEKTGMESFNLSFDPTLTPETTIVAPISRSRLGALRGGFSRTFSQLPTWDLWLDFQVPDSKLLRNLSVTATTNERQDREINLQYRLEF